jgi:3-dehydroquinate synthase
MCLAADMSQRLQHLAPAALERCLALVERAGLPVRAPRELSVERLLELMAVDKKVQDGRVRLVLLNAIGEAYLADDYDTQPLQDTLTTMRA